MYRNGGRLLTGWWLIDNNHGVNKQGHLSTRRGWDRCRELRQGWIVDEPTKTERQKWREQSWEDPTEIAAKAQRVEDGGEIRASGMKRMGASSSTD